MGDGVTRPPTDTAPTPGKLTVRDLTVTLRTLCGPGLDHAAEAREIMDTASYGRLTEARAFAESMTGKPYVYGHPYPSPAPQTTAERGWAAPALADLTGCPDCDAGRGHLVHADQAEEASA
jgi:hypothetical protein